MATILAPIAQRRYQFNAWLSAYSERERKRLKVKIKKDLRTDPRTLAGWLDMPADARADVPFYAVRYICELLGKRVDEALTEAATLKAAA